MNLMTKTSIDNVLTNIKIENSKDDVNLKENMNEIHENMTIDNASAFLNPLTSNFF